MDWGAKVELFEEIRREYEFGVGTIKGVARKLNVHRRMVREAIGNAVPARRKKIGQRRSKLTAHAAAMDRILEQDRRAPRKQRHTAHRIWERLRAEIPGFDACERSVRKYVEKRKQELGLTIRETCVPQSYDWGAEAQVDWYEAWADLSGERVKLQVFSMRSMASGGAFHRAYFRATQQAFLARPATSNRQVVRRCGLDVILAEWQKRRPHVERRYDETTNTEDRHLG